MKKYFVYCITGARRETREKEKNKEILFSFSFFPDFIANGWRQIPQKKKTNTDSKWRDGEFYFQCKVMYEYVCTLQRQ